MKKLGILLGLVLIAVPVIAFACHAYLTVIPSACETVASSYEFQGTTDGRWYRGVGKAVGLTDFTTQAYRDGNVHTGVFYNGAAAPGDYSLNFKMQVAPNTVVVDAPAVMVCPVIHWWYGNDIPYDKSSDPNKCHRPSDADLKNIYGLDPYGGNYERWTFKQYHPEWLDAIEVTPAVTHDAPGEFSDYSAGETKAVTVLTCHVPVQTIGTRYTSDCVGWTRYLRHYADGVPTSEWTVFEEGTWKEPYVLEIIPAGTITDGGVTGRFDAIWEIAACVLPEPGEGYRVDCTGVYWFETLDGKQDGDAMLVHEWLDPYALETWTGENEEVYAEPAECLQRKACVEEKQYYQYTLTKEGAPTCYMVTWDTKDEIGKPNEYWIPNAMRQQCVCGFVADNAPYGGWVTRNSCTGEYSYHGRSWGFFKERLLTPNWVGSCGLGGGGGECLAK